MIKLEQSDFEYYLGMFPDKYPAGGLLDAFIKHQIAGHSSSIHPNDVRLWYVSNACYFYRFSDDYDAKEYVEKYPEWAQKFKNDLVVFVRLNPSPSAVKISEVLDILHGNISKNYPTYEELEKLYRNRRAFMPINHINHREFVYQGVRFKCGFESASKRYNIPEPRWVVYNAVVED